MYDIASAVAQWQAAGEPVMVARMVAVRGLSSRNPAEAVAHAAGFPLVGSVLSGAVDAALIAMLEESAPSRMVELSVDDPAARRAGLSCGGQVRLVVGPATDLPAQLWRRLAPRLPACLVTEISGGEVGRTQLFTEPTVADAGAQATRQFAARVSQTVVTDATVVSTLWPVPTLVIVGGGSIADALAANATLLGWKPVVVDSAPEAVASGAQLSGVDGVAILSHQRDVYGPALTAALGGGAGYIGALGSRRTQDERAQWLDEHGIVDHTAIRGPAGLDIGANTPAEIAVAILAEMLAVRSGTSAAPLGERDGPIHRPAP